MLQVRIKKKLGNFLLDVDFSMDGGIFAILGASGCGKSMTLKCIAGIERPDEGRIVLNDRVLFDSAKRINLPPQKRKVGYMFQDYALFPTMNVVQNIQAGMGRKPDPKKVREYITGFQLGGLEHHMPDQLSGGQKQRVAMARMLAAEPEVLLLDEPFAALDSYLKWKMEQQMLELLQKVQTPVLFVSHSRDEVYRLCDTVSCIHQGRMEVIEPVKEFFRNPKTKTAALLSGCKNICAVEAMESHRDGNWLWTSDWTGELASGYRKKLYRHGPSGSAPTFLQRKNRRKDVTASSRWENTELWKIPLNGMFPSEKTDPASGCNGKQRKRTGIRRRVCRKNCM